MTRSIRHVRLFLLATLLAIRTSHGFGVPQGKPRPAPSNSNKKRNKRGVISAASLELPISPATATATTSPLDIVDPSLDAASSVGMAAAKASPISPILSFLQTYKTTLISILTVTLGAVLTQNLRLSAKALQTRRNMLAGSIIFSIGDVGAQLLTLTGKQQTTTDPSGLHLDQQRLAISTVLGAFYGGICNPAVYALAETVLPGGSIRRVLLKMALSCSILSTAGNYATMFFRRYASQVCDDIILVRHQKGSSAATTRRSLATNFQTTLQSCNRDMPRVLKDDLRVWPLYDIVVFSVIPPSVRPIANACMSSLWSMYMSMVSAKTQQDDSSTIVGAGSDGVGKDS